MCSGALRASGGPRQKNLSICIEGGRGRAFASGEVATALIPGRSVNGMPESPKDLRAANVVN